MYSNETIARVVPLDGNYMVQRYRPDYDDWCNMAIYDDEQCALRRASKYATFPTKGTDNDTHKQANA
jgi:hypothetical protein